MKPRIVLATDHAGFELKESVRIFLQTNGYEVVDVGAIEYVADDDYPVYMKKAAQFIQENKDAKGIIFGWSGQGEAMVANRFSGVRASVWYGGNEEIIKLSREHNDANVLSIGAGFVSKEEAVNVIKTWLSTSFNGEERHVRRIAEIDN